MEKLDFIDSKFRLALLAARRAKQLVNGSRKRIEAGTENPLSTAIDEIYANKVKFKLLSEDEMQRLNASYYSVPPMDESEEEQEINLFAGRNTGELDLDDDTDSEEEPEEDEDSD
ncbi:MAG: DNA-directed RNA polymerase subunit omega [Candidatus Omnitrophota bacterium]